MLAYLIRRLLYVVPILIGVNLLTFALFFVVNSPDDMARMILGDKHVTQDQIDNWKLQHGYNLPAMYNRDAPGIGHITQTIFWKKSLPLFVLHFGTSDRENVLISHEIARRIWPSLAVTGPMFLISLFAEITIAMVVAFYRGSAIDLIALVLCVVSMSISILFYIIGGQAFLARGLKLVPISGYAEGLGSVKFVVLPILLGFIAYLGQSVRYNRTIFLEEINKDYVRTARAKGLGEGAVLFKHALKNTMVPMLTWIVVAIPTLIMGNLLLENFFAIPGLGNYIYKAIAEQDFAIVRAMVYLGSLLYILGYVLVDVSYTLVDPRIRLE